MMRFLRFALGVRFAPGPGGIDAALAQASMAALLKALSAKDLDGLELYGGPDALTVPESPAFIAVIKGGSLRVSRRIHQKLVKALGSRLSPARPFIENNRVAHIIDSLCYYGRVGADGALSGGEGCFGLSCR